jgi:RNA polymerase subunit RPABC4/transcription elongation factor Spt4
MFCPKCGSLLQTGAQHCPGCGTSLEEAFSEAGPEKGKKKQSKKEKAAAEVLAQEQRLRHAEALRQQAEPLKLRGTEPVPKAKTTQEQEKTEPQEETHEEWKVRFKDGTVFAPVNYDTLMEWFKSGQIDQETPVARNALTAEWVPFKDTKGLAEAQAKKEGEQLFCTSCGAAWPAGTKFCTKCGTNIETGEKIGGVGEKRPETVKRRGKTMAPAAAPVPREAPPAPGGGVVKEPPVEAAQVAQAEAAVEAPVEAEVPEALALPAAPRKGKRKVVMAVAVLAVVVAALAVLAPDRMSGVLDKVKGLVGVKRTKPSETTPSPAGGVRDQRSVVESLRERISSVLGSVPFSRQRRADFDDGADDVLKMAAEEFSDTKKLGEFAAALTSGELRKARSLLEDEKKQAGTDYETPAIDATLASVEILLGEKSGLELLGKAMSDPDVARAAASFCRGAVEGCLDKLLPEPGKKDPWGTAAEILGANKDSITDEFLAGHSGQALAGMATLHALTGESAPGRSAGVSPAGLRGAGKPKGIRTKAFLRFFSRGNPSVQAALVELGQSQPRKGSALLKNEPLRVAFALRLISERTEGNNGKKDELLDLLKEGTVSHPENAFYHYALAVAYFLENKVDEAARELAAANEKALYDDFRKERAAGMVDILDTLAPCTAAAMGASSAHLSALAKGSRGYLDAIGSYLRVGRRQEALQMLGEWRKACERLRAEASSLNEVAAMVSAAVPAMAIEADYYRKDGDQLQAWRVRKALMEAERAAMAVNYGAAYGPTAVVFVKEVFSEKGYETEFLATDPEEILAAVLAKATERLDALLKQDPAGLSLPAANLQDPYFAQAKQALDQRSLERAFDYAYACLARNPGHVLAFKVMEEAVQNTPVAAAAEGPRPVAYLVVGKKDASTPAANRLVYEIQVVRETTKEEAVATVRTALQGFLRREKPDAIRINLLREGNPIPFVTLDWAPGGEWDRARTGTPEADFREKLSTF